MPQSGCVVFLIEESTAMASDLPDDAAAPPSPGPRPTKASRWATALNAWLQRAAGHSQADVAIVGYSTDKHGEAVIGSRWAGPLASQTWVNLSSAAAQPLRVEQRARRLPGGKPAETQVDFPIWYEARTVGKAPQVQAWNLVQQLLSDWGQTATDPRPPVIVHVSASPAADGNPQKIIEQLLQSPLAPIVLQLHLRSTRAAPPTLYPSNRYYLLAGGPKDLFGRCSVLPSDWRDQLGRAKQPVQDKAVALVYNARMTDVAVALNLVEQHLDGAVSGLIGQLALLMPQIDVAPVLTSHEPMPVPETQDEIVIEVPPEATDGPRGVVFLLDRSVADPYAGSLQSSFGKLQDRLNNHLGDLAKKPTGKLEVALVSYGTDYEGASDVRTETWAGEQFGRTWVLDDQLASAAIRTDEDTREIPDGIGGLIRIPIKRLVFLEAESSGQGSVADALAHAARLLAEWRTEHVAGECFVIHLSRAGWSADALLEGMTHLSAAGAPIHVYAALLPDDPHPSVSYPIDVASLETPALQAAFAATSPLFGAASGAVLRPGIVQPTSRGLVVNAEFDVLTDSVRAELV